MKKIALLILCVCALALAGCQSAAAPTLSAEKATSTVVGVEKTSAPTVTTAPEVVEKFDTSANWLQAHTVTSQAKPGKEKTTVVVKEGGILFDIPDNETYTYTFYKASQKSDIAAQIKFESLGIPDNGIALVCRAKEDYSAWYEARVSSAGLYHIFKFDQSLKDSGSNPYVDLKSGTAPQKTILPLVANTIKFSCSGQTLSIDMNAGKYVTSVQNADLSTDGLVGIGAMSYSGGQVQIKVDQFALIQP